MLAKIYLHFKIYTYKNNTKKIQREALWCKMFADDIVLVGENTEEVNQKLDMWRLALRKGITN